MPYVTKKNGDQYCVFKKGSSSPIKGGCHKKKTDADKHRDALNINVSSMFATAAQREQGNSPSSTELAVMEEIIEAIHRLGVNGQADVSAITSLQESPPQLTTIREVEIVKTGIEYPLSTGPCTFTPEDLAAAVGAQDDPAIAQPRIWLGHPDDPRIHGQRHPGGPPSGEPAVGRVMNMRLAEEGHTIIGDLEGVPVWLAGIMASAYPSRSIEGNFDVETVTGKKWRLVINGLALLGVCWPGVSTLEDIASLYTQAGPDGVEIIEATKEMPLSVTAAAEKVVSGQSTVEDLRRQYYDSLSGDQAWWWIRSIMINPNELIVDDDDGGLYSQSFDEKGGEFEFGEPVKKKIQYVNASDGAIVARVVDGDREHVALFANRGESRPEVGNASTESREIVVRLMPPAASIQIDITKGVAR